MLQNNLRLQRTVWPDFPFFPGLAKNMELFFSFAGILVTFRCVNLRFADLWFGSAMRDAVRPKAAFCLAGGKVSV